MVCDECKVIRNIQVDLDGPGHVLLKLNKTGGYT